MHDEKLYKAMIYSAIATFLFYSADIDHECTNSNEFREKNAAVVDRVFQETLSVFNYELSWNQMTSAMVAYVTAVKNPQSVETTEVFQPG